MPLTLSSTHLSFPIAPVDSLQCLGAFDIVVLVIILFGGTILFSNGKSWQKKRDLSEDTTINDNDGGDTEEVDNDRSIVEKMRSSNKNCVVLFGSQTGSAEDFASRLAKEGAARFSLRTMVADLEDFNYMDLNRFHKDKVAIFVLASYGEGEPTDNAIKFFEYITNAAEEASESDYQLLSSLNYVAFGLGNSTYEHYNSVVRKVDSSLEKLGAHRIGRVGEGDDGASNIEEDFLTWKESMWSAVVKVMGLEERETVYNPLFGITARDDLTAQSPDVYLGEPNAQQLERNTGPYNSQNPFITPVIESREIFHVPDRNCIHMELDISRSGLSYQTGDHVAIWPTNSSTEVDRFLKVHGLTKKRNSVITVEGLESTAKVPFPALTTYDSIIRYYLEIGSIVSRQFVSALVPFAPDEKSKVEMAKLGSDKAYFSETVTKNYLNIAQLLDLVGGGNEWKEVPFSIYIESLHKLQPRYYSISSSSLVQKDKISITVAVESVKLSSRTEAWKGVATNYLLAIKKKQAGEPGSGDVTYNICGPRDKYKSFRVPLHIRQSNFKLPSDPTKPIIMIGPGSGVAPFRGFVQERAAQAAAGQQVGKTVLFYGYRSRDQDFVYAEDWKKYEEALGDKFKLVTAASREGTSKVYVQHRLREHAREVNELLQQSGHFYVCGDAANMAREVSAAVVQILLEQRGITADEAEEAVKQMRSSHQYQEDTW